MIKNSRKLITLCLLAIASATACNATSNQQNVEVSNVKSGLVCLYKIGSEGNYVDEPHVCFETEDIQITGQGQCVFNGENKPCTWYGFEFDYNNKTNASIPLTCHFNTNKNDVIGDPEGIKEDGFSSYDILLEPGIGHISNPQYTIYANTHRKEASVNLNKCEIQGQDVFRARFNIIMPNTP